MGFVMRVKLSEILRDGTLKNEYENGLKSGYQFEIRLGYYRGMYLSVIEELSVEMDGCREADENVRFCINQKEFLPGELAEAYHEFWNIKKPATIRVSRPGGLKEGAHEVKLTLMLRNPYLPLPGGTDGQYTPIDSCDQKQMQLTDSME